MRVTKYTHACVRIDEGERAFLIDPGIWVEPDVYEGVDEILITHEHFDHVDAEALRDQAGRNSALLVRAPAPVAETLREAGVPVEERHYAGVDHVRMVLALSKPLRGRAPVLDEMTAFLRLHTVD